MIVGVITIFNKLYSMNHANKNDEAHTIAPNNNDVVLMSESDQSAINETLYLQQNPANAAHLKQSMEQLEKGHAVQLKLDE